MLNATGRMVYSEESGLEIVKGSGTFEPVSDFVLRDDGCRGGLYLLSPVTPTGMEWAEANIDFGGAPKFCKAIAIEARHVSDVVIGALEAGMLVWAQT